MGVLFYDETLNSPLPPQYIDLRRVLDVLVSLLLSHNAKQSSLVAS